MHTSEFESLFAVLWFRKMITLFTDTAKVYQREHIAKTAIPAGFYKYRICGGLVYLVLPKLETEWELSCRSWFSVS